MQVSVAGNIGAGKTSLTELLAKHYKWDANFEEVIDNPYLDDFYNHMERWSFNLQIYFLKSRFSQILQNKKSNKTVFQALKDFMPWKLTQNFYPVLLMKVFLEAKKNETKFFKWPC